MKKTNRTLHWLTLFVGSIGVCAFLLVCFILIYPTVFGSFSPKEKDAASPIDIAETHIDDNITVPEKSDDMPATSYQEEIVSDTHTDKVIELPQDNDVSEDRTSEGQDIAKSSVSEAIEEHTIPDENTVNAMPSSSEQQIIPEPPEESSADEGVEEHAIPDEPEPSSQDNTAEPAVNPTGTSRNNNFNTYDNAAQQQTDDSYVLNTSSMKIHHKTCDSVKKIAPQNYSTSNASVDELIGQGYSRCGICFK